LTGEWEANRSQLFCSQEISPRQTFGRSPANLRRGNGYWASTDPIPAQSRPWQPAILRSLPKLLVFSNLKQYGAWVALVKPKASLLTSGYLFAKLFLARIAQYRIELNESNRRETVLLTLESLPTADGQVSVSRCLMSNVYDRRWLPPVAVIA
jgi:hypothetical protein